mgnify:CR=1 FL=1
MSKLDKILCLGLASALAFGGYSGIRFLNEQANKPMPAPDLDLSGEQIHLTPLEVNVQRTKDGYSSLSLYDEDRDGSVDALTYFGWAEWVAEGVTLQSIGVNERTKIMSPEMRDAASRALQSQIDLHFETWKRVYELENKEK